MFNYSRKDLLKEVNNYLVADVTNNTRTFTFNAENQVYTMIDNSGETSTGQFTISGVAVTPDVGSLPIIEAAGKYSLFNMCNVTTMVVENLIIQNAVISTEPSLPSDNLATNASVFDVNNAGVDLTLTNVTLKNNAGNALYNVGKVTMSDVTFLATGGNVTNNTITNAGGTISASGTNLFRTNIYNLASSKMFLDGTNTVSGAINNSGIFAVNGATPAAGATVGTVISGLIENNGEMYFAGTSTITGIINNSLEITTGSLPGEMGVVAGNTAITFNSTINNAGTITIGGDDILNAEITSYNGVFGSIIINKSLAVAAAGLIGKDNIINIDAKGTLNIDMGTVYVDSTDTLAGTIVLGSTDPDVSDDTSSLYYYGLGGASAPKPIITANSGNFYLEDGALKLDEKDTLADAVNFVLKKGSLEIKGINTPVLLSSGDKWSQDVSIRLVGSGITLDTGLNENSVMILSNKNQLTSTDDTASLINNGVELQITADNSKFNGSYTQEKIDGSTSKTPSLKVSTTGVIFSGTKTINSGSVNIENEGMISYTDFKLAGKVDDKVTFANYSAGGIIDTSVIEFTGESATATFGKLASLADNAEYTLGDITATANNRIIFENSNVAVTITDLSKISEYVFKDSVVNLQEDIADVKYNNYQFNRLTNNNSSYKIDVDLTGFVAPDPTGNGNATAPATGVADTITIADDINSAGAVVLSNINFMNMLDQFAESKVQILTNSTNKVYLELSEEVANTTWNFSVDSHATGSLRQFVLLNSIRIQNL